MEGIVLSEECSTQNIHCKVHLFIEDILTMYLRLRICLNNTLMINLI